MATSDHAKLPVEGRLVAAASGVPTTARGKLMSEAADTIVGLKRELAQARAAIPAEPYIILDPASGPAVFYLGLDGTLYRYSEDDPRPIPGMVDRAVARALLGAALRSLEEADRG